MGRSCSEKNGVAERARELVNKSFALSVKLFFSNMFRKDIMGVSREFDEFLERILVEHEENLEGDQDRDMIDHLLEAYRNEEAEYKITRKQIKSLIVVKLNVFFFGCFIYNLCFEIRSDYIKKTVGNFSWRH